MKIQKKKPLGNPLVIAKVTGSTIKKAGQSVKSFKAQNPSTVKIIALSFLGLVGLKIVSSVIKKGKESGSSDSFTEDTVTEQQPGGGVLSYNPSQLASEYDNAMGTGWTGQIDGTNVNPIIELATKSRGSRWKLISQAYKNQTGNVLLTKIKNELHALEYKAFVAVINEKQPTIYKFSIGEMLNLTNVTSVLVYNIKTKKKYKTSFRWNGSFVGVVKSRSQGIEVNSAWYTLSKYPDLQIHQNYLKRDYDSYTQQIWLRLGV